MPKYTVNVEETIVENRIYEIEADDPKSAALEAYHAWIDRGEEPPGGPGVNVIDRTYVVRHPEKTSLLGVPAHLCSSFGDEIEEEEDNA